MAAIRAREAGLQGWQMVAMRAREAGQLPSESARTLLQRRRSFRQRCPQRNIHRVLLHVGVELVEGDEAVVVRVALSEERLRVLVVEAKAAERKRVEELLQGAGIAVVEQVSFVGRLRTIFLAGLRRSPMPPCACRRTGWAIR